MVTIEELTSQQIHVLSKYLWLKERILNVFHLMSTSTRCVQKINRKAASYPPANRICWISRAKISPLADNKKIQTK